MDFCQTIIVQLSVLLSPAIKEEANIVGGQLKRVLGRTEIYLMLLLNFHPA